MVKKFFVLINFLALFLIISSPESKAAGMINDIETQAYLLEFATYSEEDIMNYFDNVLETYDLYEPLSPKDQLFVETFATPLSSQQNKSPRIVPPLNESISSVSPLSTYAQMSVRGQFNASDFTITTAGSIYQDLSALKGEYGGNLTTSITGTRNKIEGYQIEVTHTAFGLLGAGGSVIGIIHHSTITSPYITNTALGYTYRYTGSNEYYGLAVSYGITKAKGTVTHYVFNGINTELTTTEYNIVEW